MRVLGRTLLALSLLRVVAGAAILVLYRPGNSGLLLVCLALFSLAQLSDNLDGWFARRYSTPSTAGYLQDSVSDKLFHTACLLALTVQFHWLALILWCVIGREFTILALRVISTNVDASLQRFRIYSVLYGALLRIGILLFFLTPLFILDSAYSLLAACAYIVSATAVACGAWAIVLMFKSGP